MIPRAGRGDGRTSALSWFAALAVLALLLLASARAEVGPYDEGLILYGAARVARGDAPYRDFWSMYGPGGFYALAVLDRVFGESVLTGRAFDAVCRAAVVVLVYALTRRRAGRPSAAAAAALAFALLAYGRGYLAVAIPATACVLAAMLALEHALVAAAAPVRGDRSAVLRGWALAGFAAGVATLFRHDFGLASAAACLCALPASADATLGAPSIRLRLGALAAGFGAIVLPALAALLVAVPATDLYQQLVAIPVHVYAAQRSLPYPTAADAIQALVEHNRLGPLLRLVVYVPPAVSVLGFAFLLARGRHGVSASASSPARTERPWFVALLVLNTLLAIKGSIRVELLHFIPALTVSLVLITNALAATVSAGALRRTSLAVAAVLCAGAAFAALRPTTWQPADAEPEPALYLLARERCTPQPRLGCFRIEPGEQAVLDYLRAHARAGDTLYVGTGRHDRLFINNVELYFLSGLRAATRWHDLHPGVQTTAAVQQAMVRELGAHPPAFVVLNTAWDERDEPNQSRTSSGVTLLDDFLRARYTVALTAGTYTLWVPRAARAPS